MTNESRPIDSSGDGANTTGSPGLQDPFSHLRRELFGRWHTGSVGNTRSVCLKSCGGTESQHTRHQNSTTGDAHRVQSQTAADKALAQSLHREREAIIREKFLAYEASGPAKEDRPGWKDLREEVILTKGTTRCHVCGTTLHPSAVEIDHVLPRARFKDHMEADCMKHLQPICTSCHRAKTQSDLKVLSRVSESLKHGSKRGG